MTTTYGVRIERNTVLGRNLELLVDSIDELVEQIDYVLPDADNADHVILHGQLERLQRLLRGYSEGLGVYLKDEAD